MLTTAEVGVRQRRLTYLRRKLTMARERGWTLLQCARLSREADMIEDELKKNASVSVYPVMVEVVK